MSEYRLLQGDCLTLLPTLPAGSVHCCISSPPYFGLRSYLKADDPAGAAELGAERTPGEYVARLVAAFREVRHVLHDSGSVWLNLGDSYAGSWGNQGRKAGRGTQRPVNGPMLQEVHDGRYPSGGSGTGSASRTPGLAPKSLLGIPWRVAFALQEDGWVLRSACPWLKRNAMCESVKDRPASAVEYVFLFAKGPAYFYDQEAVRKPLARPPHPPQNLKWDATRKDGGRVGEVWGDPAGRSRRSSDWWYESAGLVTDDEGGPLGFDVPTRRNSVAHFAVMPQALVLPCVLAGTSARGACPACGAPWVRVTERSRATFTADEDPTPLRGRRGMSRTPDGTGRREHAAVADRCTLAVSQPALATVLARAAEGREDEMRSRFGAEKWRHWTRQDTGGRVPTAQDAAALELLLGVKLPFGAPVGSWQPSCACPEVASPVPCTVLDPFAGVSTVGVVALKHGRRFVGVELNADYLEMGRKRLDAVDGPLFAAGGAG